MVSNEQRRRQLAREKFERQQERREAARRKVRRRNAVIAAGLAVVVAAGATAFATGALSGDDKKDTAADAAAPSATPSRGPDPCAKAAPGAPAAKTWKTEPEMSVDTSASYAAKLDTTCGTIDLKLDAAKAPHTVNSFNFLSGQGYFDHTTCHRLTTDPSQIFVLQCGDPKGTGMGDPGYRLKDENLKDPAVKDGVYPAGTVAMANAGPDTGGSQFFLVYKDSKLAPNYTPFGKVGPEGMKVLQKIAAAGEQRGGGDGPPNATVVVNKAAVTKS
ncbi:peptidylprolyl isomerase [Streptomyces sp. HU2014]|uniref:Peptidyl-prolyl cis-trans isomerase n=1 Tax=Streptomyces albireticuli TaxID=1940 RepID=A0A1Z2L9Z1_9ACTN|nr:MULTISPECIES: peptidylprolyl isomerase [Streptomyces]ARZ71102.1 peptidylprolyl isomerase [Streptomyces albireticuli]UQI44548.1 peptidylprolyl isomerase [Streptomyces sp. HU2014]